MFVFDLEICTPMQPDSEIFYVCNMLFREAVIAQMVVGRRFGSIWPRPRDMFRPWTFRKACHLRNFRSPPFLTSLFHAYHNNGFCHSFYLKNALRLRPPNLRFRVYQLPANKDRHAPFNPRPNSGATCRENSQRCQPRPEICHPRNFGTRRQGQGDTAATALHGRECEESVDRGIGGDAAQRGAGYDCTLLKRRAISHPILNYCHWDSSVTLN
jgi:hypothetical protein